MIKILILNNNKYEVNIIRIQRSSLLFMLQVWENLCGIVSRIVLYLSLWLIWEFLLIVPFYMFSKLLFVFWIFLLLFLIVHYNCILYFCRSLYTVCYQCVLCKFLCSFVFRFWLVPVWCSTLEWVVFWIKMTHCSFLFT